MKKSKHDEQTEHNPDHHVPSIWNKILGIMSFSFVDLAGEFLDLYTAWKSTRRWQAIWVLLPIVFVSIVLGTLMIIGKLYDSNLKVVWYVERAEKEVRLATGEPLLEENGKGKNGESQEKKSAEKEPSKPLTDDELKVKTEFIDALFRRVLQLEKNNKRALYYIAYQMSRYGKTSSARPIMESLAPDKISGFAMAHAWLAGDMIQRATKGEQINKDTLKHHLKHGIAQERPSPGLQVAYTQLLQQDDQYSEAESVIKEAAKYEPKLLLNSIQAYKQRGMIGQAKAHADILVELVKKDFDGEKSDEAIVLAAQAYVMTSRIDDAIQLLHAAVTRKQNSPLLRRAMSDACRLKFRETVQQSTTQIQINLELLNIAMVADPSNIAVQEELNALYRMGIGQDEATVESLRSQIATNGTSFAARLIMAEASFRKGEVGTAINQYEVIMAELPNMTLVLNNLAMLYTQVQPPKTEESLKLINRAIEISPAVAEFYDTRGEVLVAVDRKKEAVESYKRALELNPERVSTREKLIQIFEETGATEEANAHRDKLAEIKRIVQ
ncbi:MAG: tetratricopeptide repeat protein, partial [Pirellula sp.]